MRASFSIGKLFGIPIRINYTWFLIFVLVTVSLAMSELPAIAPGFPVPAYWLLGVLGSLLFFSSVLAHELAHSLIARSQGIPVRDITLFLFGGVSSVEQEADQPGREALMAGIGPATSLALALISWGISLALTPLSPLIGGFFALLSVVNAGLAIFNLLPGLPMDGGRILRAIIWKLSGDYRRATRIAAIGGRGVSFLLIGGGILLTLAGNFSGLWLALIGWFMDNAATQSYQMVLLQESLRGVTVSDLMSSECAFVPRGLAVAELVDHYVLRAGGRCFVVTDGERLSGLVTVHNIRQLPRERWPFTPVGEIMIPRAELVLIHPHEDAWTALRRMDEANVSQMPVEQDGQLLGMIGRDNLLRYVRRRAELGL